MGKFLSDEDANRLEGALQEISDGNDVSFDAEETAPVESSEPVEDVNQEAEGEADSSPEAEETSSDSGDSAGEEEKGKGSMHRVPYDRFKSVVDARNQFRGENDALKSQLGDLERQVAEFQKQPAHRPAPERQEDDPWDFDNDTPLDPGDKRYSVLESRLNNMAVYQAEQQLELEIQSVQSSFPTVPRELLLQAVVLDGASDLSRVAENYSAHISSIEEGAIARHLAQAPPNAAPVPPRAPKSSGTSIGISTSQSEDQPRPRNIAEASKALHEFLKRENPFA